VPFELRKGELVGYALLTLLAKLGVQNGSVDARPLGVVAHTLECHVAVCLLRRLVGQHVGQHVHTLDVLVDVQRAAAVRAHNERHEVVAKTHRSHGGSSAFVGVHDWLEEAAKLRHAAIERRALLSGRVGVGV